VSLLMPGILAGTASPNNRLNPTVRPAG
jgi:hypothetical protein